MDKACAKAGQAAATKAAFCIQHTPSIVVAQRNDSAAIMIDEWGRCLAGNQLGEDIANILALLTARKSVE